MDGVAVRVRVQPKASRDAWQLTAEGGIRVSLTAPPVEGAANKALCGFVAKQLGVSKRAVALATGERSRRKTLHIQGVTAAQVRACLGGT